MAQQYDPVTWRNVSLPDQQSSLINMVASKGDYLNKAIESFQQQDANQLKLSSDNRNKIEKFNTNNVISNINSILNNPNQELSLDAIRKSLAGVQNNMDPSAIYDRAAINEASSKLYESGNALLKQRNEELDLNARANIAREFLQKRNLNIEGTSQDLIARQSNFLTEQERNLKEQQARASMAASSAQQLSSSLQAQKYQRELIENARKIEKERLGSSLENEIYAGKPVNRETLQSYFNTGGRLADLKKVFTEMYDAGNPTDSIANANHNRVLEVTKGILSKGIDLNSDPEFTSVINDPTQDNGFNKLYRYTKDGLVKKVGKDKAEKILALAKDIALSEGSKTLISNEYNHNLLRESNREAMDPVVRASYTFNAAVDLASRALDANEYNAARTKKMNEEFGRIFGNPRERANNE